MKKQLAFFLLAFLAAPLAWGTDNYQELDKLFRAKQYKELRSACETRLKTHAKSLDAYYFLSLVNLNEGKGDAAVSTMLSFEKYHGEAEKIQSQQGGPAVMVDAYYKDLYYVLGQYYVRQQKYDKALSWLNRSKAFYSDDPMLQFFLGRCYGGIKDYDNAIKAFQKEYKLDPKEPSPLYNIACCCGEQGKAQEAAQWLRKAIAAYPKFKEQAAKDDSFKKISGSKAFKEITAD